MTARIRFKYGSGTPSTSMTTSAATGTYIIDITLKNCSHCVKIYNLHPGDLTAYFDVPSGNVNIKIDQSGTGKGIIKSSGRISDCKYTILVDIPPKLQIFQDDFRCPKPGTALVRVLPTSPDYSPVRAGTVTIGTVSMSVISGGVYTAFVPQQGSTMMVSHDNDAPRSAPPQACEKTVDDFNIIKFSGLWYRQISGCTGNVCSHSTVTYTPLDKMVRVHETCYNAQWMRLGEINTMAVMLRVSELTLMSTMSNAIDMTMSVPMITSVSGTSLASMTSMTGMTGTIVNDMSNTASMTNMMTGMNMSGMNMMNMMGVSQYPGAMVVANPMMVTNPAMGMQMVTSPMVMSGSVSTVANTGTISTADTTITLVIHSTDYTSYALVGTPTRTSFHILSRCRKMDPDDYKYLLKKASDLGYNTSGVCKEIK